MKNIFVLFSTLLYSAFANNCYTPSDILNSDVLFSYKNNVYDITGYKHPGGKSDLLKTVSVDLSIFFEQSKYKFHVGRSDVKNDLEKMYVGQLQDNCTDFTTQSTSTEPITDTITTTNTETSTKRPKIKTTTEIDITTIPTTIITLPSNYTTNTTSSPSTTTTTATTSKIPCEQHTIKSNSISIHNLKIHIKIFIISFLISLLI